MRIALCLSGQPRFVGQGFETIQRNILDVNPGIDVFMHCWWSENISEYSCKYEIGNYNKNWSKYQISNNALEEALSLYQPKAYYVSEPIEYQNSTIETEESYKKYYSPDFVGDEKFRYYQIRNSYSMFDSIQRAHLLQKTYALANNFKYDCVIRCRFDTLIGRPIQLNQYNMSYLWFEEMSQPDDMVSDWFNFSNSDNMDAYSSVYTLWELLYQRSMNHRGKWCNELLIKEALDLFSIPYKSDRWALRIPRL